MFTASIGKYLYALGGLQPDGWADPNVPELRAANGDAPTAAAIGSALVSVVSRRGAGTIRMAWAYSAPCRAPSAGATWPADTRRFEANVTIPFGFEEAVVWLPPLETATAAQNARRGGIVLRELRSGLRFPCEPDGEAAVTVVDDIRGELRRAGVLRLVLGGAGRWSEATVMPGAYELVMEPMQ